MSIALFVSGLLGLVSGCVVKAVMAIKFEKNRENDLKWDSMFITALFFAAAAVAKYLGM